MSPLLFGSSGGSSMGWLASLASVDPGPLFVLSLLPYLAFLRWARRSDRFPPLALRGFQFTLVFVAVTIVAAVVAEQRFGQQLADVDLLHGGRRVLPDRGQPAGALGVQPRAAEPSSGPEQ